jgi:acetoin utilization deacetylase AcuC-like enzyme
MNDDRVFTVSLHGENNFPFRKKTSNLDIGFKDGTVDEIYLDSLDQVLKNLAREEFDLVFFQAGVDALLSDSLGLLNLSRVGMSKRNQRVFDWRRKMGKGMLIFMGGGYAKPIEDTVNAFADLFMMAAHEVA